MSFSDLTFLFYFLPLFFAVYYILPFRFKNAALVLGSFAFYFIGAGARDTLLLSSTSKYETGSHVVIPSNDTSAQSFASLYLISVIRVPLCIGEELKSRLPSYE